VQNTEPRISERKLSFVKGKFQFPKRFLLPQYAEAFKTMVDSKRQFLLGLLLSCSLYSYPVRAQDNLKPFVVDHRKAFLSHSPVDMSFLLDAPAGKHGFITVKGGHLAAADGQRIRLWGVNISDMGNSSLPHGWIPGSAVTIPTKEDAPLWAATLARYGVNTVRQFLDFSGRGLLDPNRDDTQGLDAEQLDREDYFLAELEKRGIYADLVLLAGRSFKVADGVHDTQIIQHGVKGIGLFDVRMIELQRDYARQLLTHRNPYTGLEYRNDPAIAMIEINNENALPVGYQGPSDFYENELTQLYTHWLARNIKPAEIDRLRKIADVKQSQPVPLLHGPDEVAKAPAERFHVESRFINDTERDYFDGMRNFLREQLGIKCIIIATSVFNHTISGYPLMLATSSFESVDGHDYWEHPGHGEVKRPMVDDPYDSTVVDLSQAAVAGKPYTVSEVNNPFPSEFDSEGIPILAAYGDFQDWDAIIFWTFEPKRSADWKPYVGDPFDISLDPVKMAELAGGALTFLRADVAPARETITRSYTRDQALDSGGLPASARPYFTPGFPAYLPLQHEQRISSLTGPPTQAFSNAPAPIPIVSDTGQLKWYTSPLGLPSLQLETGMVTVDSPRTQTLIGFIRANKGAVSNLAADVQNSFCTIVLTSMDSRPIAESSHMLLITGSREDNTGMAWDSEHTQLLDWGRSPSLIEPVVGMITLHNLQGAKGVQVRALDGSGQPFGPPIRAVKQGKDWQFSIGTVVTPWYEVTVSRK
jgi:hypothetical protein